MSHLNVSDLKIENLTNFIMLFPFLISISYYYDFLWLTRSRDTVMAHAKGLLEGIFALQNWFGLYLEGIKRNVSTR